MSLAKFTSTVIRNVGQKIQGKTPENPAQLLHTGKTRAGNLIIESSGDPEVIGYFECWLVLGDDKFLGLTGGVRPLARQEHK